MERLGRALRGIRFRTNAEISLGGHHLIPKKLNRVHRWYRKHIHPLSGQLISSDSRFFRECISLSSRV